MFVVSIFIGCNGKSSSKDEKTIESTKILAPEIITTNQNDKKFVLSKLKGKVVVLNFWAWWCKPCRKEVPDLVKLQEEFKDKLKVVGVTVLSTPKGKEKSNWAKSKKIAKKVNMKYEYIKSTKEIEESYKLPPSIPQTYIIDTKGNIVEIIKGGRTFKDFKEIVKKYLK